MPPHSPATSRLVGRTGQVDLGQVTFRASIDYVLLATESDVDLPPLDGTPKQPKLFHGEVLTVQDPSPDDLRKIAQVSPRTPLLEMEVAIDVRPRPCVRGEERVRLLETVMVDLFASEVNPASTTRIKRGFRAIYRRLEKGYQVKPFNFKLPLPTDQQLHGGRYDDVQVKIYFKRTDQRRALASDKWVARIEVRLAGMGLESRGLRTIEDLLGFKYRKQLMPFFTHVKGSRRRRRKGRLPPEHVEQIAKWRDGQDRALFEKNGVGALLGDLKVCANDIRLVRDIPVNDRMGQALTRLEKRFQAK